jgi:hypothetical protein
MNERIRRPRRLARLLLLVGAVACGDKPVWSGAPEPASIAMSPSHGIALNVGIQASLGVVVRDAAGNLIPDITGRQLAFTSRNPSVATVDSTGRVTAVRVGSTYVVATLPTATRMLADSVSVTVLTTLDRAL